MDVKVTLNIRRVVILSAAFIVFGLSVFFIGMVVGAKARPPEVPPQMEQAKATNRADKIPELEKPSVEDVVASLPDALGKDKLVIPEVDVKKEVADKLTVPEVDVKNEMAVLVPPVLNGKVVADPKIASGLPPYPAGKTDAGKETVVEKKPLAGEPKADTKISVADENTKAQKPSGSFTIQAGAFMEKTNAEVMLQTLREKGYTPYIHTIWDEMKRQWHTVRFGNYEDHEEASKSAADFTKKERIPTSVRAVGVL